MRSVPTTGRPSKAQGLGATVAGSPAEAVEGADVVITMLSDGPTVAAVMEGITLTRRADLVAGERPSASTGSAGSATGSSTGR